MFKSYTQDLGFQKVHQGQGHRINTVGTNRKVLSEWLIT